MKILGIIGIPDADGHDGAAALIVDNKVVFAIVQERISRHRYAMGEVSADAAKACLAQFGLQLSDLDHIGYSWNQNLSFAKKLFDDISVTSELTEQLLQPEKFGYTITPPIHFISHHFTHAASGHYTSGFSSSAILVIDGRGGYDAISHYHAKGTKIELLGTYPYKYSLGAFYYGRQMHGSW